MSSSDLEMTPQIDREEIKRMGKSLIAFSRLRSLLKMSRQQLANMPKEVMIACAPHEIALVWDKLPEHLQNDIDILKYQYCTDHDDIGSGGTEVNDGPSSRRIFCCYCNVNDINVASENKVDISSSLSSSSSSLPQLPRKKRRLNPLSCCCKH